MHNISIKKGGCSKQNKQMAKKVVKKAAKKVVKKKAVAKKRK